MSKFGPWYVGGQALRARAEARRTALEAQKLSADEAAKLAKMTPRERQTYIAIKEGRLARDGTIMPGAAPRGGLGCGGLVIVVIVVFLLLSLLVGSH